MSSDIRELGIEYKDTRCPRTIGKIYEIMQNSVVGRYVSKYNIESDIIQSCYNEAILDIMLKIDKLDVDKYSIDRTIYLKTSNKIADYIRNSKRDLGTFSESIDLDILYNSRSNKLYEKSCKVPFYMDISDECDNLIDAKVNLVRDVIDKCIHGDIMRLKFIEGYSYSDMSDMLNISEGTLKSRIFRGRLEFKEKFQKVKELLNEV